MSQLALFQTNARTATLDRRRIYRYTLWRRWHDIEKPSGRLPYVNFVLLNPSTADESTDDPTVRKCVKFARSWGFDGLCITNLFAYRATDFSKAKKASDPIGYGNDRHILNIARDASLIVCAWSRHGSYLCRSTRVRRLLDDFDLYYLRMTAGEPWHPLYLPDDTTPTLWRKHDST